MDEGSYEEEAYLGAIGGTEEPVSPSEQPLERDEENIQVRIDIEDSSSLYWDITIWISYTTIKKTCLQSICGIKSFVVEKRP